MGDVTGLGRGLSHGLFPWRAPIEDSPNGVASATAAGRHVVAAPSLLPIPPARGRVVLSSLREVALGMLRGLVGYDTME